MLDRKGKLIQSSDWGLGSWWRATPPPGSHGINQQQALAMDAARLLDAERDYERQSKGLVEPIPFTEGMARYSEPYNVFGRSRGTSWIVAMMVVTIIAGGFVLVWAAFPWEVQREGLQSYGVLRDNTTDWVELRPCPDGTYGAGNEDCSLRVLDNTPVDQQIFNMDANPCDSMSIYASGRWKGHPESGLVSRVFDASRIRSDRMERAVLQRDSVQFSRSETGSLVESGGGRFHDFTMSCIYTVEHPNMTSDMEFAKGVLDSLVKPEHQDQGRSDRWKSAYALARATTYGPQPVFRFKDTINPTNARESLLYWDVGSQVREFPVNGEARERAYMKEGCTTLMLLKRFDEERYISPDDCTDDVMSLYKALVREAARTEILESDITVEYLNQVMESRDVYNQTAMVEALGSDFIGGWLEGIQDGFEPYREFLNEHGHDVPALFQLRHWIMRMPFLIWVSEKMESDGFPRWLNYVRNMVMTDGMQYTTTLLHSIDPDNSTLPEVPSDAAVRHLHQLGGASTQESWPSGHLGHPHMRYNKQVHRLWVGPKPMLNRPYWLETHVWDKKTQMVPERSNGLVEDDVDDMTELMTSKLWEQCTWIAGQYLPAYHDRSYRGMAMTPESQDRVAKVARRVSEGVMDDVLASKVLSPEAKTKIVNKVDRMQLTVGAPGVHKKFEMPHLVRKEAGLLQNAFMARNHDFLQSHLKSAALNGTAANRRPKTMLEMPTKIANAYYDPTDNTFTILAGISTLPFVHENWSDAALYGTLGAVIGHEMTHGLDPMGSQFDENGSLKSVVPAVDRLGYEERKECFVQQYSNNPTPKNNNLVKGGQCVTEISADVMGARAALRALETLKKEKGGSDAELTQAELREFLEAYVQMWATAIDKEGEAKRSAHDPHPPAGARQDGTLRNLVDSEGRHVMDRAYGCPVGSPMRPEKTCGLY